MSSTEKRKHSHYFRSVKHLTEIDLYRFFDLFNVTDQALGHAIKKLVAPGGRGAGKDFRKDVQEAIDTLTRRLEMLDEDTQSETEHSANAPVVVSQQPEYDPASVALTDADGWGPWIKWGGGECPLPLGTPVSVRYRSGNAYRNCIAHRGSAHNRNWIHGLGEEPTHLDDIVEYQVKTN